MGWCQNGNPTTILNFYIIIIIIIIFGTLNQIISSHCENAKKVTQKWLKWGKKVSAKKMTNTQSNARGKGASADDLSLQLLHKKVRARTVMKTTRIMVTM